MKYFLYLNMEMQESLFTFIEEALKEAFSIREGDDVVFLLIIVIFCSFGIRIFPVITDLQSLLERRSSRATRTTQII